MKYIANVFVTSGRNIESNNIESFEEIIGLSNSCFIIVRNILQTCYGAIAGGRKRI
jgi:hypothetical protein